MCDSDEQMLKYDFEFTPRVAICGTSQFTSNVQATLHSEPQHRIDTDPMVFSTEGDQALRYYRYLFAG